MQNKLMPYSSLLTIVLLVFLSLLPLLIASRYPPYLNNDAYITLIYAKNLARGNGFVLNYPPTMLGTTMSLFTLAYLPDFDQALASIRSGPWFTQWYQPVATLAGLRKTDFTIYYKRLKG